MQESLVLWLRKQLSTHRNQPKSRDIWSNLSTDFPKAALRAKPHWTEAARAGQGTYHFTLTVQSLEHDANRQPEWEKLRCRTWSLCSFRACTSTQGMVS